MHEQGVMRQRLLLASCTCVMLPGCPPLNPSTRHPGASSWCSQDFTQELPVCARKDEKPQVPFMEGWPPPAAALRSARSLGPSSWLRPIVSMVGTDLDRAAALCAAEGDAASCRTRAPLDERVVLVSALREADLPMLRKTSEL
mmetsp:Transcript_22817/g.47330  ORF Transcript_22817/g.47330 Transcript_22817/m.47330 type:complete len:143 (+) Transcript_22817:311-739(+)